MEKERVALEFHHGDIEEVRYIGMDEKSFKRGQSYISTMVDLNRGASRVLDLARLSQLAAIFANFRQFIVRQGA